MAEFSDQSTFQVEISACNHSQIPFVLTVISGSHMKDNWHPKSTTGHEKPTNV
jgi:hypothetical protein